MWSEMKTKSVHKMNHQHYSGRKMGQNPDTGHMSLTLFIITDRFPLMLTFIWSSRLSPLTLGAICWWEFGRVARMCELCEGQDTTDELWSVWRDSGEIQDTWCYVALYEHAGGAKCWVQHVWCGESASWVSTTFHLITSFMSKLCIIVLIASSSSLLVWDFLFRQKQWHHKSGRSRDMYDIIYSFQRFALDNRIG